MLTFKSAVGLMHDDSMVGVRVQFGVRQYDISVESLENGGLVGFKPQKGLKLQPHGDLLLTAKEIASGEHVQDKSGDPVLVQSFIQHARLMPRIIEAGEGRDSAHGTILTKLDALRGKAVFTKTLGDGELELVLWKEGKSGIEVRFHSNSDGQMYLDAESFCTEVKNVREVVS